MTLSPRWKLGKGRRNRPSFFVAQNSRARVHATISAEATGADANSALTTTGLAAITCRMGKRKNPPRNIRSFALQSRVRSSLAFPHAGIGRMFSGVDHCLLSRAWRCRAWCRHVHARRAGHDACRATRPTMPRPIALAVAPASRRCQPSHSPSHKIPITTVSRIPPLANVTA